MSTDRFPSQSSVLLAISERVYQALLYAYPAQFRRQFGAEMAQVFRTSCRATYRAGGTGGVLRQWLPILWDWAWTALREQIASVFDRSSAMSTMNDTTIFDRQLGDIVWMMTTGLYAGYSLVQTIEAISLNTTEPAASIFKRVYEDLAAGVPFEQALANLKRAVPSVHLQSVLEVIEKQRQTGGNLAMLLEPLSDQLIQQVGSDPSLYPAMREEASLLGAQPPERARSV